MFRSQFSGKLSAKKVPPTKVVIQTRKIRYENYIDGELKVTYGFEIVKEIDVLPSEVEAVKQRYGLE